MPGVATILSPSIDNHLILPIEAIGEGQMLDDDVNSPTKSGLFGIRSAHSTESEPLAKLVSVNIRTSTVKINDPNYL